MNALAGQDQGRSDSSLPGGDDDSSDDNFSISNSAPPHSITTFMNPHDGQDGPTKPPFNPRSDARDLVRLVQCSFCSYPLRSPVTLPCGNSLCRQCLPPGHVRDHVTYPAVPSRQYAIACPFADCQAIHPLEDCSVNVCLSKLMDAIQQVVTLFRNTMSDRQIVMEESMQIPPTSTSADPDVDSSAHEKGHAHTSSGCRLMATFDFAETGLLHYTSDVIYTETSTSQEEADKSEAADQDLLTQLKEASHKELECHVCYALMLDPTTTPCGHTYCRKCLARILDHSSLCPICRRELFLPASLSRQPANRYLVDLLDSLCPDQVAARAEAVALEEQSTPNGLDTALFPCTLAFPGLRTYLHIFEPRYRLMIRRAMEKDGRFGMVAYNRLLQPQGTLGRTIFLGVGTMLQIERVQVLDDGRSFVECKGLYRFRVRAHGQLDGYTIANVEKLEDISLAEEEALEAQETSVEPPAENDALGQLNRMSTEELCEVNLNFIARARTASARWFSNRMVETYGEPPEDPATLPYWLAAVLPIVDEEKYKLLPTTSVRERLKITARWVHRIEAQRW